MTQTYAVRRTVRWSLCLLVLCLLRPHPVEAQGPYRLDPGREWTLLGIGAGLNLGGVALIHAIEPFSQAELASLDPAGINSFDRSGMKPFREDVAGDALHVASFALPFALLADERTRDDWKTLGVMWSEVLLVNAGVTALAKGLAERTRPYAYDTDAPMEERTHKDAKLSFFSGHTSTTAATCFFMAKVVSDYPFRIRPRPSPGVLLLSIRRWWDSSGSTPAITSVRTCSPATWSVPPSESSFPNSMLHTIRNHPMEPRSRAVA